MNKPEISLVSGILDTHQEHGFLRVDGYAPSRDDVFIPPVVMRKHQLRRGDLLSGAAQPPNQTDRNAKRRALSRLDTVNGVLVDAMGIRPDFYQATPLHPQERLRLETEAGVLTTRVIDLVTPMAKGQRALIVSPPKAGKTMVLQAIAHAIATNHPECHLMALLIDERPEEVTDMQRTVRGEVVASAFDRPPSDHIAIAELAIERAKRLVEMGQDVVILLDSLTRLARAYNLAAPSNGRTLSGGIDSTALTTPKRLLGAARNLEGGGSLTIIASALVETGSLGDTLIFEELKSTGNAELRLQRAAADRRIFPAVDVEASSTRREELILNPQELVLVQRLRRALQGGDPQPLLDHLRKTSSNAEFLMGLARSVR